MRDLRILAFDDVITGTTATWYTSDDFINTLGMADGLVLHAVTTSVSSPAPTLTCQVEHSADARHWLNVNTNPEINGVTTGNDLSFLGYVDLLNPPMLTFVRIRITLAGTSPACRLKLHVTGRTSRSAAGGVSQMPAGAAGLASASGQAATGATPTFGPTSGPQSPGM